MISSRFLFLSFVSDDDFLVFFVSALVWWTLLCGSGAGKKEEGTVVNCVCFSVAALPACPPLSAVLRRRCC